MHRLLIDGNIIPLISNDAPMYIEANDALNYEPGKAHKSGTIEIPNTPEAIAAFGNHADRRSLLNQSYDCIYELNNIKIKGKLFIRGVEAGTIKAQIVAGGGVAVADFKTERLRDLDWTGWNHVMNLANVVGSETGTQPYIYDLADRGKFIDTDKVNIAERFPAISVKAMLQKIFEKWSLLGPIFNDPSFTNKYLLFTGNSKVNNNDEWESDAPFRAEKTAALGENYSLPYPGGFTITRITRFDNITLNPGDNYYAGVPGDPPGYYRTPEAGSYRFRGVFDYVIANFLGAVIYDFRASIRVYDKSNNRTLWAKSFELTSHTNIVNAEFDTGYVYLAGNTDIDVRVIITGILDDGNEFPVLLNVSERINNLFYAQVTRWFGYGQTVDFSKIVPDWSVNEFIKWFLKTWGQNIYVNSEEKNIIVLPAASAGGTADWSEKIESVNYEIQELTDYVLSIQGDSKDALIKSMDSSVLTVIDSISDADAEAKIELQYSPTIFRHCGRVGIYAAIPFLWSGGTPDLNFLYDPEYEVSPFTTDFNTRLLTFEGRKSLPGEYTLCYGAIAETDIRSTQRSLYPEFSNADLTPAEMLEKRHGQIIEMLRADRVQVTGFLDFADIMPLIYPTTSKGLHQQILINTPEHSGYITIQSIETNGLKAKIKGTYTVNNKQ